MHTPDWRQSLGELCRVARERVVFDYPALVSAAALQAAARRVAHAAGARVEAYRVFCDRVGRRRARRQRLPRRRRAPPVRAADRVAQAARTRAAATGRIEGALARVGPARGCSDRPSRSWRSVARPSHRRHRVHRRPPRAGARRPRRSASARWCATSGDAPSGPRGDDRRRDSVDRRSRADSRRLERARCGGVEVVYHIAAIYRAGGASRRRVPRGQRRRRCDR